MILSTGVISVSVSGGVTPYEIFWSNGETTQDISGLQAGPYEIQVIDDSGCKALKSISIEEPGPIVISVDVFETACGQANGSAEVNVTGGTSPYNYVWSNGSTATKIENLQLGIFRITVSDDNSCAATKSFAVSEIGSPTIIVDSINEGTCGNADGAVYISIYGDADTYNYAWSDGTDTEDLVGVNPGEYSVTVSDESNCRAAEVIIIESEKPDLVPICLVSVDSASSNNEIIWQKPTESNIAYYNIYRETTESGKYLMIGSQGATEESIFRDVNSNAQQRSYRYKMSVTDICDVESDLSDHHKTMHLTMNLGLNNTINLIWDHYEGFDFSTYIIYRFSDNKWDSITSIPNNLTSYTDLVPPFGQKYYQIEVRHPYGCEETKATNRNSSRSNVGSIAVGGVDTTSSITMNEHIEYFNVYPNPNDGSFTISTKITAKTDINFRIFNIRGELVKSEQLQNAFGVIHKEINIQGFSKGIYYIQVVTPDMSHYRKVIVH